MKAITERSLIRQVAELWNLRYGNGYFGDDKVEIGKKLLALDPETATANEVDLIIGNRSWTWVHCDECGSNGASVVQIGQEPDFDSSTANVCGACLEKALACLKEAA